MEKKAPTITVGIPAYNEERNIRSVLESVLQQRGSLFRLEKIIVVSDGSDDRTESMVREIAAANPIIELVADHGRKGKITRLNQLCRMNQSDFLVFLDADTVYE